MIRWMAPGTVDVHVTQSPTSRVVKLADNAWRLEIPPYDRAGYRLAQLDDHGVLRRSDFRWKPPLKMSLQARISAPDIPGTWGFGLWNDPFSFLLAYGGVVPRLPALPEAAWFFHASPHNYLSLRDDLPGSGFLAATFSSKKVPFLLLAVAAPLMALSFLPGAAQAVRKWLRRLVHQETALIDTSITVWHSYEMECTSRKVIFSLDGMNILETGISPCGPLSLVIWVDNQFAALPPKGRLRYGTLPNLEPAWMEVRELSIDENP
jgi:hypothetical protein